MGTGEPGRSDEANGGEPVEDKLSNSAPLTQMQSSASVERRALATMLAAVGIYLVVASLARGCGEGKIELERSAERIGDLQLDLNRASWAELIQLPGVGPKLADRIIAHRAANGEFSRPEELEEVEGIGPKLLERVRPYVYVAAETPDVKSELAGSGE